MIIIYNILQGFVTAILVEKKKKPLHDTELGSGILLKTKRIRIICPLDSCRKHFFIFVMLSEHLTEEHASHCNRI